MGREATNSKYMNIRKRVQATGALKPSFGVADPELRDGDTPVLVEATADMYQPPTGYPPQSNYPQQMNYPPQQPPPPGYPPQMNYQAQPGYPQPGYYGQPQPGYGQPQPGYGQPMQYAQYGQQHQNTLVDIIECPKYYPIISGGALGTKVTQQPTSQPVVLAAPYRDHMTAAILVTLCCFWPTGIIAILRASEARSAMARGDVAAAASHSRSAKSMVTISIVIGVISIILLTIILGVYFGLLMSSINKRYNY
ncbi:Proline-rich transmembrane protein 1 [Bulinus truncatus]|nr:Proline-rich transmembrane protein 1 [Bulinus truncatus]